MKESKIELKDNAPENIGGDLIPDAPTPQSLTANDKFQMDDFVKVMALQSQFGNGRGKIKYIILGYK